MLQKRPESSEPLEGEIISPLERAWLELRATLGFRDHMRALREQHDATLGSRLLQAAIAVVFIGVPLAMILAALARLVF